MLTADGEFDLDPILLTDSHFFTRGRLPTSRLMAGGPIMKPLRVVMLVLALSLMVAPARAADIGLLGGDYDPQSIFDIGFNPLELDCDPEGAATTGLPPGFYCALYEIFADDPYPEFVVESIDFRLLKPAGGYFSTEEIGETLFASELSDLASLGESPLFPDGITFRLFDSFSIHCPDFCSAAFFSSDDTVASVSIRGVNNIANVPEPATMLLLVPAAAALMARRKWGRRGTSSLITSAGTSSPVA